MKISIGLALGLVSMLAFTACSRKDVVVFGDRAPISDAVGKGAAPEVILTILTTNDIHGGVEPFVNAKGEKFGGLANIGGVFRAIREGMRARFPGASGVITLDGGDQFQGTLLSNFDEGKLTIEAMSEIGYDAVVPGNHDYDFGPLGWLQDKVVVGQGDQDPRGAFKRLKAAANFPFLSSNTFYKDSMRDPEGRPVAVEGDGCKPIVIGDGPTPAIDWARARRPDWVRPYIIREIEGVRVAVIGVDLHETPTVTTPQNVTDLCFGDHVEHFLRIRASLEGKADVFLALMHDGSDNAKSFVQNVVATNYPRALDALVSGHTHRSENFVVAGVPMIQAGANAERFGRIDLVYSRKLRRIDTTKTKSYGGIQVPVAGCAAEAKDFCAVSEDGSVSYEGVKLVPQAEVISLVARARESIAPVAGRKLGTATGDMKRAYIGESPLANALTDVLRSISGAQVAIMNGGGIRADLAKGDVDYETFFRVQPFGNRGVVLSPMRMAQLLGLLTMSAQTCGTRGGLMASGVRVVYEQNCQETPEIIAAQNDHKARLLRVELVSGEVLLDAESGIAPDLNRVFTVATLDFLHSGGSGYVDFVGTPLVRDIGILREAMTEFWLEHPFVFEPKTDGRWVGRKRP